VGLDVSEQAQPMFKKANSSVLPDVLAANVLDS
jgi:hypothetical protein